jgi:hypothetical protein
MKRRLIISLVMAWLVLGLSACGGGTESTPGVPTIAKVRMWITLSNNPDAAPVTTLTPEQTAQASIWARGTTEEKITFKVNLYYDDKFTTLMTGVRTAGSKAVAVGGFATALEPGQYTFKAISGAMGAVIGSLDITVALSLPPVQPAAPSEKASPTPPAATSTLSEQPDSATFQKYFSDLGIGKMPEEVKDPPVDLQKNVSVFTAGDQICLYGTVILECMIRSAVYDVSAKKVVREGGLPQAIEGGFAGWEPVDLPVGKYEYKIYVGDVLVGVYPFEVIANLTTTLSSQPTPQPSPKSSEQPDKATFQKYFSDMGLGKLPAGGKLPQDLQQNATIFSSGDSISLYGIVIQEVQISARYYNVATKQSVDAGAPPAPYKVGGFGGAGPLTLPVGKYDLKVYVGAVLVAAFPFEVQ